jgi:hypothetical protein
MSKNKFEAKEPLVPTEPIASHAYPSSSFSTDRLPTGKEITNALRLPVFTQDGSSIPFGFVMSDLSSPMGEQPIKIIVCFIRHFLCPLCQDYMYSIGRNIDPEALEKARIKLVIVGNGGWEMIRSYRRTW